MRIKLWSDVYVERREIDIDPGAIQVSVLHVIPSLISPAPDTVCCTGAQMSQNNL